MKSGESALEQAACAIERAGNAPVRGHAGVCADSSAAARPLDVLDERAGQVREWLFLLLRFAITRDPQDQLAVLMTASGIDLLGRQWGRAAPSFFRRSSDEVCKAIMALDDPDRDIVLKKHMRRIEHPGLKRAFQAALYSEQRAPSVAVRSDQSELWAGLRR